MIRRASIVFKILGIIFLSLGALFLILSGVFFIVLSNGAELKPDDITAFNALIFTFLGIGIIFAVLGLVFFLVWRHKESKAARLKRDGICYDAEITGLKSLPYMYGRRGFGFGYYGSPSFIVECWYRNQEGKTCLVKSDGLLMNPLFFGKGKDNLKAKVYVDRDDPKDYYVDVTDGQQSDIKFDNDYR